MENSKTEEKLKKITVLIPCHNEEEGLGKVLGGIPYYFLRSIGYSIEVIVIDNNSTDNTSKIAIERGVRVIREEKKGKGNAIKTGFLAISPDTRYVVMLDGDNTYKAKEMSRLLEPLITNFCDAVIGTRLGGKMKKNSFRFSNRVANWLYTFLVRQVYIANTTDVLSGYYAWKKSVVDNLLPYLNSGGFAIEMDMLTKMMKLGYEVYSVQITYDKRDGVSKLQAFSDGLKIFYVFFKNLFWKPQKLINK